MTFRRITTRVALIGQYLTDQMGQWIHQASQQTRDVHPVCDVRSTLCLAFEHMHIALSDSIEWFSHLVVFRYRDPQCKVIENQFNISNQVTVCIILTDWRLFQSWLDKCELCLRKTIIVIAMKYRIKPSDLYILSCGKSRDRGPRLFPQLRM